MHSPSVTILAQPPAGSQSASPFSVTASSAQCGIRRGADVHGGLDPQQADGDCGGRQVAGVAGVRHESLQRHCHRPDLPRRLAWKRSGDGCASHHCFSSWWALTTMQPRTPGTANSSTSLPLSPHTITPSSGALPASSICIERPCPSAGATQHACAEPVLPSDCPRILSRSYAHITAVLC